MARPENGFSEMCQLQSPQHTSFFPVFSTHVVKSHFFSGKVKDRKTQNIEVLIDHLLPFSMRPRSHGENASTQRLMWHHGVRTNFTAFDVISQVRFQVALITPRCYAWCPGWSLGMREWIPIISMHSFISLIGRPQYFRCQIGLGRTFFL